MPRQLRVEYAGALYHVMSRGDGRDPVFLDEGDCHDFIKTLGEVFSAFRVRVVPESGATSGFRATGPTLQENSSEGRAAAHWCPAIRSGTSKLLLFFRRFSAAALLSTWRLRPEKSFKNQK
jgi:hypothetical protein